MLRSNLFSAVLVMVAFASCDLELHAKTYSWSASGTEISYQIDIKPEWQHRKYKKFNHGIFNFWNAKMRIQSESLSQGAGETVEQTLLRRVAKLSVLGKIKEVSPLRKLAYSPRPYIYSVEYTSEGKTKRNLEALWHIFGGRRIIRVMCSADKSDFAKYHDECWNAILSVQPINEDEKAIPQYQMLASQTQGHFYKTESPDEIAGKLVEISNSVAAKASGESLDVAFVVDNTGSMGDSLQSVKDQIRDFMGVLAAKVPNIRYGLVQYRDKGDEFVTRTTRFTNDASVFTQSIGAMEAQGGGDWPEALIDGLNAAVTELEWKGKKRILILIGDAPGHEKSVEGDSSLTIERIVQKARAKEINLNIYSVYSTLKIIY